MNILTWSLRNEAAMTKFPCEADLLNADLFPASGGPPHALFDAWREADPVHWNPPVEAYNQGRSHGLVHKGFWVLTRYQDVFDASRDQSRFTSHDEGFLIWDLDYAALLREILEQIPDIRISGEVKRLRSIWFDAIVQLPVTYTDSDATQQLSG